MEEPLRFKWLSTPNPGEWGFVVFIKDDELNLPDFPTPGVTTYATFSKPIGERVVDLGDYIYTYPAAAPAGWQGFNFIQPKTILQQQTPFRTTPSFKRHPWLPILHDVRIQKDAGLLISSGAVSSTGKAGTSYTKTPYCQVQYTPGGHIGTLFILREYFGPTPFNIGRRRSMVPTAVILDLPGNKHFSFPEALHDEFNINAQITGEFSDFQDSVEMGTGLSGSVNGQKFPATNATSWIPDVVEQDQKMEGGGWYMWEMIAQPPPLPETISEFS